MFPTLVPSHNLREPVQKAFSEFTFSTSTRMCALHVIRCFIVSSVSWAKTSSTAQRQQVGEANEFSSVLPAETGHVHLKSSWNEQDSTCTRRALSMPQRCFMPVLFYFPPLPAVSGLGFPGRSSASSALRCAPLYLV